MASAARDDEQARRNPDPLKTGRTATQVIKDLKELKCIENKAWSDLEVREREDGKYDIMPVVALGQKLHQSVDIPAVALRKPRQRQEFSPHAQIYSWLRINNWYLMSTDAKANVLEFTKTNGELERALLQSPKFTGQQKLGIRGSLKRFRMTLEKSVGRKEAFNDFVEWLDKVGRLRQVGSMLPRPSEKVFKSHLCAFAQLIKVTKDLYVQVLAMRGKLKEIASIVKCGNAGTVDSQDFKKRVRGIWGIFHRACVPRQIYIMAWCEYLGMRVHGAPYGPVFFYCLWGWYVRNVLASLLTDRKVDDDARKELQKSLITNYKQVLAPESLYQLLRRELRAPLPRNKQSVADDPWEADKNYPVMPGPSPEFSRDKQLVDGWEMYFESLPTRVQNWLGTKTAPQTGKAFMYRKYSVNEATKRLLLGKTADPEEAVMFRFTECIRSKPRNRNRMSPPAQTPVAPFLFAASTGPSLSSIAAGRGNVLGMGRRLRKLVAPD